MKSVNNSTELVIAELCKRMKLDGMFAAYQDQLVKPEYANVDFSERFCSILKKQAQVMDERKSARLMKQSNIKDAYADISRLYEAESRKLDLRLIKQLATCQWIKAQQPKWLIVTGASGTGKTFLVKSLLKCAVQQCYKGLYLRTPELMANMEAAVRNQKLAEYTDKLMRLDVLVLDDFNLVQCPSYEIKQAILDIFDARWMKKASIIASQFELNQIYDYLGERADLNNALYDRLIHHIEVLRLEGESLRHWASMNIPSETKEKKEKEA